jgi:O-methyltransferase
MPKFRRIEKALKKLVFGNRVRVDYFADGLGVRQRNLTFLEDLAFQRAWNKVSVFNNKYWNGKTPDIQWRAHLSIWAAEQALRLEGDFAEFGVNTGILSAMIFHMTTLSETDKRFFLFDTYEGIPIEQARDSERAKSEKMNQELYKHDAYAIATEVFEGYKNAVLVKGVLPQSLADVEIDKLCFVSFDLNLVEPEIKVINEIWDKLVPGALVVLDDYGFASFPEQHSAWNEFAASKARTIFLCPTGQGLLQK